MSRKPLSFFRVSSRMAFVAQQFLRNTPIAFGLICAMPACSADCNKIIDKMLVCDPSAPGTSRAVLALQCVNTSPVCVTLPTSNAAECAAFMGCLYGD